MKRSLLTLIASIAAVLLIAQNIPRNMVILEIGTGTWCTYCPGAANAADQLVSEGKSVAVIENHNGDPFTNTESNARNSYYNISGYPTAKFDGTLSFVGGAACPNGNVYASYLPLYNQAINTPSPLSICISGSNVGNNYTINVSVKKVGTVSGTDLRLHLVVTESDIAYNWQGCMTEVNFVERTMVPSYNGTSFDFSSGNVQNFTLNFTKDPSWVASNCEVVAFVQDHPTKTIYNGCKSALTTLPSVMMTLTDFTGTPTSGCAPLNVNFASVGTGITTYAWSFPGGNPSSSTASTPTINYSATGSFTVSLKASNGVCKDSLGKTDYISVIAAPGTPTQPSGGSGFCINPPDQAYSTNPVPNATSYTWDLQPGSAGVVTPNGYNCSINFDNAFTGTAVLKVKASNSCGDGPWSTPLNITISEMPGTPGTPTGPTDVCQGGQSSYSTTGTTPTTSYIWELVPSTAGTVTPNGTSVNIDWSAFFNGPAQLHVAGINNSCQGPWSAYLDITVNGLPATFNVTGGGTYCAIGGTGVEVGLNGSQVGVDYTLYLNGSTTGNTVPGTGSPISFGNQMYAGTYAVIGENTTITCSNTMNGQADVTIDPQAPEAPTPPVGPDEVNAGSTDDYTTTGGAYASSYNWEVTPSSAGTFTGTGTTGTITWSTTYLGAASVKVQGVNTCGGGTFSTELPVTVFPAVGINEQAQQKLISIYPNPARGIVNLVTAKDLTVTVQVYDLVGSLALSLENINLTGTYRINTEMLRPGIYFFTISGDDFRQVQKLVIE